MHAAKTQMPENWLSYASLYINCHSIKTIRPTEKLLTFYKIPVQMMSYVAGWKSPTNFKGRIEHPKVKILPSSCHFFISGWINDHNSAILAPISFYLTPFSHHMCLIQMGYEEIMWHKVAAENKYYVALIPPQCKTQGSSLHIKWVLVYISTHFILQ